MIHAMMMDKANAGESGIDISPAPRVAAWPSVKGQGDGFEYTVPLWFTYSSRTNVALRIGGAYTDNTQKMDSSTPILKFEYHVLTQNWSGRVFVRASQIPDLSPRFGSMLSFNGTRHSSYRT
jgi:hypothetical protein